MIIGITGSFGAGKGEAVEYLVSQKGFIHYSASGYITEEVRRRGLPINRDSMIAIGNDLRTQHGPSHIVEVLFERAQAAGGNAVIEALRAVAEVRRVKELGGMVIGVDAKPEIRYARSVARGSEKDKVSIEKWQAQEKEESNTTDPTRQNIFEALAESDHIIENNTTLEALHHQIDQLLTNVYVKGSP